MTAGLSAKFIVLLTVVVGFQYCGDLAYVVLEEVGLEVQGRIVRRLLQLSVLARLTVDPYC